ncbi:MAG: hypothetical protein BSR46_16795 [Candidatus Dactylopiibacterium carminicum]|nr:HD domain-containing phosphohydrolase [Candidatus Dactylopiibacterium carminicum]PAS95589.1 MAG: hypothetical protein BSR46_16795 [Candidatus Dactylopiibacterium carminicum]
MSSAAPSLPEQANPHFVESLVELSATREIEVTEDVYAQNGIKLLAKGARVDSSLYDRVIQHKLRRPIETSLACRDAFDSAQLRREAEALLEASPILRRLADDSHGSERSLKTLARVRLTPQAATLFAVAEHRRPERRTHQVKACLIALSLAKADGSTHDSRSLIGLAQASLLHDIGECYIDPAIFTREEVLGQEEWRALASHPIIGAAIARELGGLSADVQTAILQHHERLDGSGYPRGVSGEGLSRSGAILGMADTLAGMLGHDYPLSRLSVALRIMPREFSPALVSRATRLLGAREPLMEMRGVSRAEVEEIRHIRERIGAIPGLFSQLLDEQARLSPLHREGLENLFFRFIRVKRAFSSTGMDGLESLVPVLSGEELAETCQEARCVLGRVHSSQI